MSKILTFYFFKVILVSSLFTTGLNTFAQSLEVGAMAGLSNYLGDMAPTPVLKETKFASGVFARLNLSSSFAWTNGINFAQVSGNDNNFSANQYRNLNFKSNIYELSSVLEFNYFKYGVGVLDNRFTSYLFAGICVFNFNPQASYNGQTYNLRDYQTEGVNYSPFAMGIPFGIGCKWILNKNINFEWQFGFRKTFTDYLDDVSGDYPNLTDQIKKSQTAAMLSDPSYLKNGGPMVNRNGYKRGNSDFTDWYMIGGICITYRIYSKIKCARFY
ncbi:MAG: DUF6089 family protein [Bacteroidia bacterium]